MPEIMLTPDADFLVKEDKFLNFLIGGICFVLFLISLFNVKESYVNLFAIPFFLGPAVLFIAKGMKSKTVITVNRDGIYSFKKLVTNWDNFFKAFIVEEEKFGRVSDNFILVIKYHKPVSTRQMIRKIKLSNTQNKSEESIIEAIKYFNGLAKGTIAK